MAHRDLHPTPHPECFGCKVLSINIGAGALANRGAEVRRMENKDKVLDGDLAAYQRLRRDGLQPKGIDGSAELEKTVNSQFDIDLGRTIPKSEESRVREGFEYCKEIGLSS